MKFFLALAISSISCAITMAEEYICQRKSGPPHDDVVVTHYFFSGVECYGAKREIRKGGYVVPVTETKWNLYYGGKLLATIVLAKSDHQTYAMEYIKVAEGMEFANVRTNVKFPYDDENVFGFKLAKDGKILRVWNLSKKGIRLFSESELSEIEARDSKLQLTSSNDGFDAPTKKEAEETMLKLKNGIAPDHSEVPFQNSTSSQAK